MITAAIKQFKSYKSLGVKTIDLLTEEECYFTHNIADNSVATIIKHMSGNMISRWTNIFTEDGEKSWRNRDAEFVTDKLSKSELLKKWEIGWQVLFTTLESIDESDLQKIIYIRNEPHTVEDAILRQLCHYSYHIGQIVFIGKMLKGQNWVSLSIPLGESEQFNQQKM
ncbi:MAG: DUF1572 family protein [Saprospiraceae bacterium]|nr:DUF1572 family protein [Saprospiraceae bacterium]